MFGLDGLTRPDADAAVAVERVRLASTRSIERSRARGPDQRLYLIRMPVACSGTAIGNRN